MKRVSSPRGSQHLSVVPTDGSSTTSLTRAQVADRLGVSISTVRRYEGARLHPTVDDDDVGMRCVNPTWCGLARAS